MQNFAYLLGDPTTNIAAIIDPGFEGKTLLAQAAKVGLNVKHILLTHTHFDHVGAVGEIAAETGADVYVHEIEKDHLLSQVDLDSSIVHTTKNGSEIKVGNVVLQCLHTPGHSPGGQCLIIGNACFAGDTLFISGCGRVDLPHSDPNAMWDSLQKLKSLPASTVIYPGHDYGPTPTATIGELCESNNYLQLNDKEQFLGRRL